MPRFYKRLPETFYKIEDLQKTVNEVQLFFYLYTSLRCCLFLLLIKCFFYFFFIFTPLPFRSDKLGTRGDLIQVF